MASILLDFRGFEIASSLCVKRFSEETVLNKRKQPRKASQPLGHIKFSHGQRPVQVVEVLPGIQDDLENAIVTKFIGALAHFESRHLTTATHGTPWPDFETTEGKTNIGIEITEVVHSDHARKFSRQRQYLSIIEARIKNDLPALSGLSIVFNDGYQEPMYPSPNSGKGKRLINLICTRLQAWIGQIAELDVRQAVAAIWQRSPTAGAIAMRLKPRDLSAPAILRFSGTFPHSRVDAEAALARSIQRKLGRYGTYARGPLWLLAYAHDPVILEPRSVSIARSVLARENHPFAEVWAIFPYAAQNLGAIAKIWQS